MKVIVKENQMKKTYNISILALLLMGLFLSSCKDYLDIVPDKTAELDLLFDRQAQAYKALATCYSYLPKEDDLYGTKVLSSDELATPLGQVTNGIEIMRGRQNVNDPKLSYWSGYNGGGYQNSLFNAFRDCNIFIENIDQVPDMTDEEKATWKAEAIFLKAYYHFLLVRSYGPIPITDVNIPVSASIDDVRVKRNTVDECFDYIVSTIDLAMTDLPDRVTNTLYLGRIDKTIAAAIKARVLLYAASPLFNGNAEFYQDFTNVDGTPLFNTTYSADKWKLAMEAAKEAIDLALMNDVSIYTFKGSAIEDDKDFIRSPLIKSLYHYRFMFTDKWNSELIWGHSSPVTSWYQIQAASLMKHPTKNHEAAWQWLAPTLRMVETYYTSNGLPIEEDLTYDFENRYEITNVQFSNLLEAQPGEQTLNLHLNREPRFYASIGFDRGYNRTHGGRFNLKMRKGEKPGGRAGSSNDYLVTGYLVKKYAHMNSEGEGYDKLETYAWPTIRLAELYLIYAEAYNEYNGPAQPVYDALNEVRSRVGLPAVEEVWADAALAKTPNKHLTQDGLRDIIWQERMIEMAFEGHRYHDVRRLKLGDQYFNNPVYGWNVDETEIDKFYALTKVSERVFLTPRDYFEPIKLEETTRNPNLVQNLGW